MVKQLREELAKTFNGKIYTDNLSKIIYATDASTYREIPLALAIPNNKNDIISLVKFASKHDIPLIPRASGTSLAGQVVGHGIVVDTSKHFNKVLEINQNEKWVRVEPGVVLDELNIELRKYGLFFGPETATSSRCRIGGMFGNNSCGAHSILYGSTRDNVLEAEVVLSDGSIVKFGELTKDEFHEKCSSNSFEGNIYRSVYKLLSPLMVQEEITANYPNHKINRRNNGYAIDKLIGSEVFNNSKEKFNFCKLLAGSEGTLAFTTEIKLKLVDLPPNNVGALVVQCNSLDEAYRANLTSLKFKPGAVELIDDVILKCTEGNITQKRNRQFIAGNPKALIVVEFARESIKEIEDITFQLAKELKAKKEGYQFDLLLNDEVKKVWTLRKAGLGLLSNIPGDKKAEPFIEDTAVLPEDLPKYMKELQNLLKSYNLEFVSYAHVGSGEIHIRPIINLKEKNDVKLFHTITKETAKLVKKYNGSLSGEHGDGRLRGEFIPIIIGDKNFELCKEIKKIWDPKNIFNPGKIVNTPKMNANLRYKISEPEKNIDTIFDFSDTLGIQKAVEKCNGSADCKNSQLIGGTMCPSYKATLNERHTTRARANVLREFITRSEKENPFNHKEIYEVMDLCLSCKACKSECPSSVDITKLKAEFLQHYYRANGIPLRTRLIANFVLISSIGIKFHRLTNLVLKSKIFNKIVGISENRTLPLYPKEELYSWYNKHFKSSQKLSEKIKTIYLFNDEFTNYTEPEIGKAAIDLLDRLGYNVILTKPTVSGRTYLSKGLLIKAREIASNNVKVFSKIITENTYLIGIEPSAIFSFRDEYCDLLKGEEKKLALSLANHTLTIDEFIAREFEKGNINSEQFTNEKLKILVHGHCHQKSLASTESVLKALSIPTNYQVKEIPSGCCGMAGSFGYEKEHYKISMDIGELVLFPTIRNAEKDVVIAASGTSCRCQIKDGTNVNALHPVVLLSSALK